MIYALTVVWFVLCLVVVAAIWWEAPEDPVKEYSRTSSYWRGR